MIFAKISGALFDKVGYWVPFALVGGTDLVFILLVIGLKSFGKFRV